MFSLFLEHPSWLILHWHYVIGCAGEQSLYMEIFISYAFNLLYSSMKAHCKLGIRSHILKIKLIMQAKIFYKDSYRSRAIFGNLSYYHVNVFFFLIFTSSPRCFYAKWLSYLLFVSHEALNWSELQVLFDPCRNLKHLERFP